MSSIDLEAIRKKIQQLNGSSKKSKINFFKVEPGDYTIRVLPWGNTDGQPFKEYWFYYGINKGGILAPSQYNKADPVQELISKLHNSGRKEDKEIAKTLYPKMRCFVPVLVRGESEDEVKVWSFGKDVYLRLLEFFVDKDIGDFTDLVNGYDLKIKVTKRVGTPWSDTVVDVARKTSPLFDDKSKNKDVLESIPNLDDFYKLQTYDELKAILENWTSSAETGETSRGQPFQSDELPAKSTLSEKVATPKKNVSTPKSTKAADVDLDDFSMDTEKSSSTNAKLDDVFDDLMNS